MRPAITFPGKDQPVIRRPKQLLVRRQKTKDTSPPFARFPNLAADARRHVGNTNRPWRAGALGTKLLRVGCGRKAQIGDLLAIRRPHRLQVTVHTRVKISQTLLGEIVNRQ